MTWRITHYPAGDSHSHDYAVRAATHKAARRKLAAFLDVPVWTLR